MMASTIIGQLFAREILRGSNSGVRHMNISVTDALKSLVLDSWYKAVMYLGAVVFVCSLFWPARGLTNSQLQLLSGGAFLLGIGEWKNHKVKAWFEPPNAFTGPAALVQTTVRIPDLFGILLEGIGIVLIVVGGWRILRG
jgi:hypothetical protein